ncbi:unannotated protein [freshwater metagenome]|uniref:Unannotated protein n=1 Tax=freshwater metagenome TaxID=449393 RepID=A0A6J6C6V5_9ZZZZ
MPKVEIKDENKPSRARSEVGRVMDGGEISFRPLPIPAMTRMLMIYP